MTLYYPARSRVTAPTELSRLSMQMIKGTGKVRPITHREGPVGGEVQLYSFFILGAG